PKGAHALREGAFDTCAPLIPPLPLFTGVPCPRGVPRLKCRLRVECQGAGGLRRLGAERPRVTGAAVLLVQAHLDICPPRGVDPLCPTGGGFPLRTVDLPVFPIHREVSPRVGPCDFGLPVRIRARWATQGDAIILLAADE